MNETKLAGPLLSRLIRQHNWGNNSYSKAGKLMFLPQTFAKPHVLPQTLQNSHILNDFRNTQQLQSANTTATPSSSAQHFLEHNQYQYKMDNSTTANTHRTHNTTRSVFAIIDS